jgi:spore germination cell wall hydrolase CwlJ-like protein/uncharacterized protein YgiM (DUF1202 family)
MKKTKRTLVSMIVFLTIFCLPAIFNMQSTYTIDKENNTEADEVIAVPDALFEETKDIEDAEDIEIKSFSYHINSNTAYEENQYLATKETQVYQADANDVPEDNSLTKATDSEKKVEKPKQRESLYANIGISVAGSFVNIREDASTDCEIVGKLYKDAAVEILDTKDDWYYVESGSVKGYVNAEYIETGIPDEELIEKFSVQQAIVEVDGLNVREKPDTESKKLTVVYLNEAYPVEELKDDWIKITIADDHVVGYVKNEYVDLLVDFKKAISREEEQELLEFKAAERAKKETEVKHQDSVNYSNTELKLLACLVHSEAGTQGYEGKLAVANVVLNRVKSSKYPDSIKSVIYQSGQFSVAASGSLSKQLNNYDNYCSTSQSLSIKAAKAALEGSNNIGTRLYFHSYKAAVKKGYDDKSTSVKLGDHLFW